MSAHIQCNLVAETGLISEIINRWMIKWYLKPDTSKNNATEENVVNIKRQKKMLLI
jgi:hypothetical protein